jgi:hypothetical protein
LISVLSTSPDFLRFRFLLVDFLVRIWLVKALERLIFPDPVSLKRLAAPRFVFIFGIILLLYTSYKVLTIFHINQREQMSVFRVSFFYRFIIQMTTTFLPRCRKNMTAYIQFIKIFGYYPAISWKFTIFANNEQYFLLTNLTPWGRQTSPAGGLPSLAPVI